MNIRDMILADLPSAIELWKNTPNVGVSSVDDVPHLVAFLERNPGMSFVAVDGEQVIGTVLGGSDGRRGYLYHLAVTPAYRRLGIGRQLVEHTLSGMRSQGLTRCHLFVFGENENGLAFWKSQGWFLREELELMSINL